MGFGAALIGAGTVLSVVAQVREGKEQSEALSAQANIAARNAELARMRAGIREREVKAGGRELRSTQRAIIGAAGVKATGSAARVLQETEQKTMQDVLAVRLLGEREATDLLEQSRQLRKQAKSVRRGARLGAAATALTGGAAFAKEIQ
jgi:predicted amino acid dehydrogenase